MDGTGTMGAPGKLELPHQHGEGHATAQMQAQLGQVEHFQTVAEVFRQLGDPTRIRIFWLLCHCEECVINISALLGMSSPAVSHHLRPLKNSGLIVCRRVGKEVHYRAADIPQSRLLHQMIEQVMEITCPEARGGAQ
ncbi:metalloregulator ArsR/SmtB family transcription factor [Acutalibacter sp. M00118]|uniref:ArsR/SmtB family transcription factor n=1 Tax=Acutalibacter caecimuris TaxID=3093657 RepID=UPI002AC8E8A5|nr:metalloregulator ArsR/SmtB family transcription factor [Acutalibacter sp. M00118]